MVFGSLLGVLVLVGTVITLNAQNDTREYREWQMAQQRAEQLHQDYLRTRNPWDYRQWQNAERQAQAQYRTYQENIRNYNNSGYDNGRYNNSQYDNRYNNNQYDTRYNNQYDSRYNTGYNNGYNNGTVNNNTFRIFRNGSYYSTDSRGSEMLKTAVRIGYSQVYNQGMMDRRRGRGYDLENASAYQNDTYGYQAYVERDQYQYYFQQGFQRGYEDGYYGRNQYGTRSGNGFTILGNILNNLINISH